MNEGLGHGAGRPEGGRGPRWWPDHSDRPAAFPEPKVRSALVAMVPTAQLAKVLEKRESKRRMGSEVRCSTGWVANRGEASRPSRIDEYPSWSSRGLTCELSGRQR